MFKELLEYEELDEACVECFGFSNVIFLKDFGPLKKGHKAASVWFQLETAMVAIYGEDMSTKLMEFPFELKAKQ